MRGGQQLVPAADGTRIFAELSGGETSGKVPLLCLPA